MKKVLALLLTLVMLAAIASACSTGSADPSGGAAVSPSDSGGAAASGSGSGSEGAAVPPPAEIGYFDPDYDYTQAKQFKVAYLIPQAGSFLYDEFDKAFASWAKRMNIDYRGMTAAGSTEATAYLSMVQTHIDQGFDGLLLDGDPQQYPAIFEAAADANVEVMSCMGVVQDLAAPYMVNNTYVAGRLTWPFVGFDQVYAGSSSMNKLIEWKDEAWPDVPIERVGVICVGFTASAQLYERVQGAKMAWCEAFPQFGEYMPGPLDNPQNFYVADMSTTGGFDASNAANLVTQILTAHPNEYDVWLLPAAMDDLSMGAANAIDLQGLTDKACTACFGGSNLPVQWDEGVDNAWRYAEFTAQTIYAEPIINALWAMMAGLAGPEDLFQDWLVTWDKGDVFEFSGETNDEYAAAVLNYGDDGKPVVLEEHTYARLQLPTYWLEKDTYQSYLAWTDYYAYGDSTEEYHYGQYPAVTDLDLFDARKDAPASYQEYPR